MFVSVNNHLFLALDRKIEQLDLYKIIAEEQIVDPLYGWKEAIQE